MPTDTATRLPFLHRTVNGIPVFFLYDTIYANQAVLRESALDAVARHPRILNANREGWHGVLIG